MYGLLNIFENKTVTALKVDWYITFFWKKGECMDQIHKRFTAEQVKVLLMGYCQGILDRPVIEEALGISKSTFFVLLREYHHNPDEFSVTYHRETPIRIPTRVEKEIEKELMVERNLIDDSTLPITTYNYSAIRDRLGKRDIKIALSTIIGRAKGLGCYQPHPRKKAHDREVVTTAIGALIQHDASHHKWSPYAAERWVLITSLDGFSRKILYADFLEQENTWAHIKAAESVMLTCGIPLRYYVDSLRVFRFVQGRDNFWRKHILQTDKADPQWRQVMRTLGVDVAYALSPQAKGKIERPYRWLQDRIVRTCAIEKLTAIDDVRAVLKDELNRYNNHQVHSTTGEIPSIRFEKARKEGNSLFRPFVLPKPYTSTKDVFCLREKRMVNGYRKISLFNHEIVVPHVSLREEVEVHLAPDVTRDALEVRIWWGNQMVQSVTYPLKEFPRVQF